MATVKKFKAKELKDLRTKSKKDLLKQLDDLKNELHKLRVAQQTGGAPAKIAQIRILRKNIARILTTVSQITKQKVREQYKKEGKKLLPLDLRPKLTRRERLRLPNEYRFKKTNRQRKLIKRFPQRRFAIINKGHELPKQIRKQNIALALSGKRPSNEFFKTLRRTKKARRQVYELKKERRDKRKALQAKEDKPVEEQK